MYTVPAYTGLDYVMGCTRGHNLLAHEILDYVSGCIKRDLTSQGRKLR